MGPEELQRRWEAARARWPKITLEPKPYFALVDDKLKAARAAQSDPSALFTEDLYLVCACLREDREAIAELIRELDRQIERHFAGNRSQDGLAPEDVRSVLLERLFVSKGTAGKLATYSASGPLRAWLRILVSRTARELRPSSRLQPLEDEMPKLEARLTEHDAELALMKKGYARELRTAFRQVLEGLDARERNVLRMYFLENLTTEQIGALQRVHRTTVARWVESARSSLLETTRTLLAERLDLSKPEVDELIALLSGRVDLTLSGLLRRTKA